MVVDTEAEFDWTKPVSRRSNSVSTVRQQQQVHRVFSRYGVRPTYVLDYPVSSQVVGYQPIRELYEAGLCEIGAHLQPWDTPPFEEAETEANSYAGNLPPALEREKLARLSDKIAETIGRRPRIYKAGRYGFGPATPRILAELGYEVDLSILPLTDLRTSSGPDYRAIDAKPFWFGECPHLLEVPMSVGYLGALSSCGPKLYGFLNSDWGKRIHLPGIFARLHLLDRITLTPEGVPFEEHCRLTKALMRRGHRVFSFTYHSPSLAPGNTPYVRTEADLRVFLRRIEQYLDFFFGALGGRALTPLELRDFILARQDRTRTTARSTCEGHTL
ncbi:MAG TPA: polysaccharide deacetylase family protein [Stellaceae bacterium]|nr:polysaccharide deacetylase family protein [Stellaceae bacterium]